MLFFSYGPNGAVASYQRAANKTDRTFRKLLRYLDGYDLSCRPRPNKRKINTNVPTKCLNLINITNYLLIIAG